MQRAGGDRPREPGFSAASDESDVAMDLQTALERTLLYNPDLVAVRQSLPVSAEAIRVARRFPTSLNPTASVEVRPWAFERVPGDGVNRLQTLVSLSLSQPIEFGHRRDHRTSVAQASYSQTQWHVLQAELTALIQTYRAHQTAVYRRERQGVVNGLVQFDQRLLETLRRQMEANQVSADDVVLAEVDCQATRQQLEAARQDYAAALADLRQQIGISQVADSAEPVGELTAPQGLSPDDDDALIRVALASRPEIQSARSQVASSRAAVALARAERIPVPSVGPVYEKDETGVSFYGMGLSSPIPVWNAGGPLLRQREAEYRRDVIALEQVQERTTAQVKATLARWRQAEKSAARTQSLAEPLKAQVARMERLFEAGQADVLRLLQVQRRSLEARSAQLDALWQATQAYADLLAAVGTAPLIGSLSSANSQ